MSLYLDTAYIEGLAQHKSWNISVSVVTVSSGTITMTAASEAVTVFQGSTAGQIIKLPDATTFGQIGQRYQFINDSTQNVLIENNAGTSILLIQANQRANFICTSVASAAGTWSYTAEEKDVSGSSYFTVTYPGTGLAVNYTGGFVNFNGSYTQIADGTITLPASTTDGWLYVDVDGVVKATASLPANATGLYQFTTDTDSVVSLTDRREDYEQNLTWGATGEIVAITYNATKAAGTLEKYARADHNHGCNLPLYKAGSVASTSFTGSPRTAAVTFSTAFPSTSYAVVVTGSDGRVWKVTDIAVGGFTINSNAAQALTGPVFWQAILLGESL